MYFFMKKEIGKGKLLCCIFCVMILCSILFSPVFVNAAEEPYLYATAAVLMDADTGRVLYSKNGDSFLANASTTKIMTCILALEHASLEEQVTVSAYAVSMPKVKLYMKEGEHFKLGDLLYSLMLESHNDTAVSIAEHVGGSIEGFAKMMNEKAEKIGCSNTFFVTPNGLDATQTVTDENGNSLQLTHGTTAQDLAAIMAYCAFYSPKKDVFLEITQTPEHHFTNEEGRSFSCSNHNAFLGMMEGALSGKTGFTNKAGYCYVGALERDGKRFTIALLGCGWPNHKTWKWADAKTLFSFGLKNYEYYRLEEADYDRNILKPLQVFFGQSDRIGGDVWVELQLSQSSEDDPEGLLLSPDEKIEVVCKVKESLQAPVKKGSVVGEICYMLNGVCLKKVEIETVCDVEKISFSWSFLRVLEKFVL